MKMKEHLMTFHLEKPYINNIGNNKKKLTVKQLRAKAEHEAWLKARGVHPDQLAAKPKSPPRKLTSVVKADMSGPQCTNGFAPAGAKKSVFDSEWQHTYDDDPVMAERERVALAQAEAKKANIIQTYNKGPVMFAGNLKMTELGKRR
jgi:hypothetical protein